MVHSVDKMNNEVINYLSPVQIFFVSNTIESIILSIYDDRLEAEIK